MIALSEEERAKSGLDSLPKVNREAIYYQYFLDEGGGRPTTRNSRGDRGSLKRAPRVDRVRVRADVKPRHRRSAA